MSGVGLNSETRYATARQFCIKRNLYLINYNRMRTQWTIKGNRDAGSSCSCDRGLHRYLRNFAEREFEPTKPSHLGTPLKPGIFLIGNFEVVFYQFYKYRISVKLCRNENNITKTIGTGPTLEIYTEAKNVGLSLVCPSVSNWSSQHCSGHCVGATLTGTREIEIRKQTSWGTK